MDAETFERAATLVFSDTSGSSWPDTQSPFANKLRRHAVSDSKAVLDSMAMPPLVVVDLVRCDDDAIDLLDRLEKLARDQRQAVVVIFSPECLDAVAARIDAPSVTLLCNPSTIERITALSFALEGGHTGVLETRDVVPEGLQSLADEVARIAKALAALAGETVRPGGEVFSDGLIGYRADTDVRVASGAAASASEVRALLRARRVRDRFLPNDLFGEPAWDMLLDLFAARIERTRVAVSSLCIAAAVPPTTALRTIRTMTERGLFARVADATDKRRIFIELTEEASAAMENYVRAARSPG